MQRPHTQRTEQYRLAMDCHQSGLFDARWCEKNNIQLSTFYNWIVRFRRRGREISASTSKNEYLPTSHQDVVKGDWVSDVQSIDVIPSETEILSLVNINSNLK